MRFRATSTDTGSLALAVGLLALNACASDRRDGPPSTVVDEVEFVGQAFADGGAVFRGIPYADPPVGELRWRPPAELSAVESPYQATEFAPACPQLDRLAVFYGNIAAAFGQDPEVVPHLESSSEDCLYLNIWTPRLEPGADLPVMVWIHGGSNRSGWSSEVAYDGSELAAKGTVFVSINYRVGPLGFFAHPALTEESADGASGNYGLMDQAAALEWIRRNIAAFGGDPARVTVFGESAGSSDVIHLMTSDRSKRLFDRAIAQSGAPMGATTSLAAGERTGARLARDLGIEDEGADGLAALRAVPADELIRRVDEATGGYGATVVVDGRFLTESSGDVFREGRQAEVPLMIGSTANEFSTLPYYLPDIERTTDAYETFVQATYGPAAERVLGLYPAESDPEVQPALVQLVTDMAFTCPTRVAARRHARAGHPTFRYYFTRVSPGPGGEALGAYHGMDIGYVFNTRFDWLPTEEADLELAAAMGDYWTRFAATGDPNLDGRAKWPAYDPERDTHLELGTTISAGEGVASAQCAFIDQILGASE